ncbi:hypothetical protein BTO30_15055 [Domibacillus antri]|uniref:IrrE N-terminal-like domain-containing protein n=2 Tax=Domibacillus antri TaxID=1714264 RepID=A0A1Q8Q287_9BACI|nr:hypothetical protein BTO30_15055 [Domibacillus antri]
MRMIFEPNFKKAEQAAYQLHEIANITALPVKVRKIDKHFKDLKIKPYKWFAKEWGITHEETIRLLGSDEGCCFHWKQQDIYLVLYNEKVENQARIRWTIAHELGHYMLKHNLKSQRSILGRGGVPDKEYDMYEKEANCFARNFLAPPVVITNLPHWDTYLIGELCNISFEASTHTFEFYKNGKKIGVRYSLGSKIGLRFKQFVFKVSNKKYCKNCNVSFVSETARFCECCGSDQLTRTLFLNQGDDIEMIYPVVYSADESGKVNICPRCLNEEMHPAGDFCPQCGLEVVNRCDDISYYSNHAPVFNCEAVLSPNQRHCHVCGCQSTFLRNGVLEPWEKIKEKAGQTTVLSEGFSKNPSL